MKPASKTLESFGNVYNILLHPFTRFFRMKLVLLLLRIGSRSEKVAEKLPSASLVRTGHAEIEHLEGSPPHELLMADHGKSWPLVDLTLW